MRDEALKRLRYREKVAAQRGIPIEAVPTRPLRNRAETLERKFAWMRKRQAKRRAAEIPLPHRPHLGCDPTCEKCDAVMHRYFELLAPHVDEALGTLWKSLKGKFQLCGELPSYIGMSIEEARQQTLESLVDWLFYERNKWVRGRCPKTLFSPDAPSGEEARREG